MEKIVDILNKKHLEQEFADDFGSPYFPLLAEIYLQEGDYIRASKVCEVGLNHDDNNIDGKFISAKVALAEKNLILAPLTICITLNPLYIQ